MATTSLDYLLRSRPADVMAALGMAAGSLSAAFGQSPSLEFPVLKPLAMVFLLEPGALPIGVFYGLALGLGIAAWTRTWWVALAVLATTMYAWSAAIHTAIRLQRNTGDDPHLIAASLAAGAVGAGITHLGCSLFAADLRRPPWRIALTCAVGAAFGMLFYMGERKILDERLLFFLWQPAVAFAIGLGLPRRVAQAT
jgi:hypothetical protein